MWLVHMCDMTHTHVWRDSCTCVTWPVPRSFVWHDSCIHVTWLIYMCDMTHPYVTCVIRMWHDSFIRVTWHIHMCNVTHLHATWLLFFFSLVYGCGMHKRNSSSTHTCNMAHMCDMTSHVRHDFTCATWLHMCDMTSHVRHDFTCATWLNFVLPCVIYSKGAHMESKGAHKRFIINVCNMTHSHVRHDSIFSPLALFIHAIKGYTEEKHSSYIHRKSCLYLPCRFSQLSIEIPGATLWNTISTRWGWNFIGSPHGIQY